MKLNVNTERSPVQVKAESQVCDVDLAQRISQFMLARHISKEKGNLFPKKLGHSMEFNNLCLFAFPEFRNIENFFIECCFSAEKL